MNSVQMHLALTHVPVILSLAGLVMLTVSFLSRNPRLMKTSYWVIVVAGIIVIPVLLSGDGAEEAVENLPNVSENLIDQHSNVAHLAMVSIVGAGLFSIIALFSHKWPSSAWMIKTVVLSLAITSGVLMTAAAHLGGQIRHSEIRNALVSNGNKEQQNETKDLNEQLVQDDD